MSKHAATAIDGWNRNILMTALTVDPSIAEDLGIITAKIASSHSTDENNNHFVYYTRTVMDIIRAGRLVGIPKPEGGMRPIVIGSFLAKLTGSAVLRRAGVTKIPDQYAINCPNGAKIIGHRARHEYQNNKAIIRLDIKNAYNATSRKTILEQLVQEEVDSDVISFFNTMYQPSSKLFILGSNGDFETIEMNEGIRQGDGPSSYFFCLAMRKARDILVKKYPNQQQMINMAFMDDTTICADPELAEDIILTAIAALEECGFEVNKEKSAVICKVDMKNSNQDSSGVFPIPIASNDEQFKMLGINITDNYEEYNNTLKKRIACFFEILQHLDVHAEIKHLILHLCGKPKLLYYCETTPPEFTEEVTKMFDDLATKAFADLIGVKDSTKLSSEILHDRFGGNIPDYYSNRNELYGNSRAYALSNGGRMNNSIGGLLTTCNVENFKSPECSHDRQWTHYVHSTTTEQLTNHEYRTALAVRCGLAPDYVVEAMGETVRCSCSTMITVRTELARHLCSCDKMCSLTFANRHTFVKDAIRFVLARYGVSSTNEPNYYSYNVGDCRPDITVRMNNSKNIAIDVTIVKPDATEIGKAAKEAAAKKTAKHQEPVAAFGHIFMPFAVETTGHFDSECFQFFRAVRQQVVFHHRAQFQRDFFGGISVALARYRATTMQNVANNTITARG
jgi:hypothetical protein